MNRSPFNFAMGSAASALALTAIAALPSHGDVFVETGDAGQTIITAETGTLYNTTQITGNLYGLADIYAVKIDAGSTFTALATENPLGSSNLEPQLFLFDSSGLGLAMGANGPGGVNAASLSYAATATGTYYIGIASYNYAPTTNSGQYIFSQLNNNPTGLTLGTDSAKAWGPGIPAGADTSGAYKINLTGVATPEPGIFVTGSSMLGMTGLGLLRGRRRMSSKGKAAVA